MYTVGTVPTVLLRGSNVERRCIFVTGNTKHFPKKPIVVTPSEILEILKAENKLK